ncbi:MAG: 50S ribosome-binding GTPase [Synergistaceae bacterium]|nr:50S ribosome-binding GTPase [Synergistaceae bacterium]
MAGIIVIIGRPNAGKSSLFNRLIEKRDVVGLTHNRLYVNTEGRRK